MVKSQVMKLLEGGRWGEGGIHGKEDIRDRVVVGKSDLKAWVEE
jgi:hypothetical protein